MATEASLTDQEPVKQSEEIKVDDDIKLVNGKSDSVSKNAELKNVGEIKAVDLASPETLVIETEEKPEDAKIDTPIEEVKNEETKGGEITEKGSESTNVKKTVETSEASLVQVSETEAAKDPTVSEDVAEEIEAKEPPPDSVTELETKEPPSDSLTTEAETKEPYSDSVMEEVKTKDLPPTSETEDTKAEAPIAIAVEPLPEVIAVPAASESAETSQDEKNSADVEMSPNPSNEVPTTTAVEVVPENIAAPDDSGSAEISQDKQISAEVEVSTDSSNEAPVATAVEPVPEVTVAPDPSEAAEISQDENNSAEVEVSPDPSNEAPIATAVEPVSKVIVAPHDSGSAEISQDKKISAEVEVSPDPSNEAPIATAVVHVPKVILAPAASGTAEISQDENISNEEPASEETPAEETDVLDTSNSVAVDTTEVSKVQDDVAVSPEVPDASEKAGAILSADSDIVDSKKEEARGGETLKLEETAEVEKSADIPVEGEDKIVSETTKPEPAAEISEQASKGVVGKVEENIGNSLQGDTTALVKNSKDIGAISEVAKVPSGEVNASGSNEEVQEKSLGGDKPALIEASRDIDLDSTSKETTGDTKETEAQVKPAEATQTLSDKFANEGLEDNKDVNKETNDAKDGSGAKTEGEAPKQEAPIKSSPRHSNGILSKVKQSIVKVKKAIIGKSASSKTMTAEGKDAIKV